MSARRRSLVALLAVVAVTLATGATAVDRLLLPEPADAGVTTFLLLGSDEGPNRSANPLVGRADGFQLLFVSGDRQHATFVSIPRDSYIQVTGRGRTRINACLVSGPENCVATVEQEFGIEVDHYLLTSMRGFANAVKAFGGLTVDVPTPVFDGGNHIPTAGLQHLEGLQALTYARDRKNRPGGDFGRSQAQAELLAIAHADVVEAATIGAVLEAATVLRRHSVTDLTGPQLVRFAFEAMQLPPGNVQRELAPARLGMAGPAAVAFLDPAAYSLIRDAADDARVAGG
jgi:polyisoprenyl-teichoic acid--peptidoglycan teichoic acid transferase